jgi:hypothetical protein
MGARGDERQPSSEAWYRAGTGGWEEARVELHSGVLLVHRAKVSVPVVVPLSAVAQVEEDELGEHGYPTVEVYLRDGSAFVLRISAALLGRILTALWSYRADSTSTAIAPASTPPAWTPNTGPATLGAAAASAKNQTRHYVGIGLLVAVALIAGWAVLWPSKTHQVLGTYLLVDRGGDIGGSYDSCYGTGGYRDVQSGMEIEIADGDGTRLATTALRNVSGVDEAREYLEVAEGSEDAENLDQLESLASRLCLFVFDVELPEVDSYEFTSGSGRRGTVTYSKAEMEDNDWAISITLGDTDSGGVNSDPSDGYCNSRRYLQDPDC